MNKNSTWCYKVSDDVNCPKCNEKKAIKNGRTKNINSSTTVKCAVTPAPRRVPF